MSESDLYRKQRAAFEEVARIVLEMERAARERERQQAATANGVTLPSSEEKTNPPASSASATCP